MTQLSIGQLKEAIQIKEQIENLEARLRQILGGGKTGSAPAAKPKGRKGPRKMSAEARAKIAAAATARWAKTKATAAPVAKRAAKPAPKKSGLTPEGRAKLAAAMKARWAARKKGGPAPNASAA